MDDNLLSVSEVARLLGAKPKDISDLFYSRELRDDIAPIVAGRRLIPEGYIDTIQTVLRRHDRQVAGEPTCGRSAGSPNRLPHENSTNVTGGGQ